MLMFNISEYRRKGKKLSDYLPWAALVHPRVILNKDGSFLAAYRFRGPDLDSCSDHELIAVRARMNNALKRLGSRWCLHVEAHRRPSQDYPASAFPDPVTAAIEAERRKCFEADQTHFESDHTLVLTYLTPEDAPGQRTRFVCRVRGAIARTRLSPGTGKFPAPGGPDRRTAALLHANGLGSR